MENETNKILNLNYKSTLFNSQKSWSKNYFYYFTIFFVINFGIIILFFYNILQINKIYLVSFKAIYTLKNKIKKNDIKISNLNSKLENFKKLKINNWKIMPQKIFKENIIFENEIQEQNNFCNNPLKFSNFEFDKRIKLTSVKFNDKNFNMYVYKKGDSISNHIIKKKSWELISTYNILKALKYFSKKNKIKNKNIYIIDIGANIGWYTLTLGKLGYKIISFEPSKINYYILKKNYCINRELKIILINKGLYNEDKRCNLYHFKGNKGNAIINCNKNTFTKKEIKEGEIILTKLDNYLPFIKGKNLLLIKIDAEGSEGKAFEGGIGLITQYQIPFILIEFTPLYLKLHGSDEKQFLQMFINNGYIISPHHFLEKKNYTIDYIIKIVGIQKNLYITFSKIFEN